MQSIYTNSISHNAPAVRAAALCSILGGVLAFPTQLIAQTRAGIMVSADAGYATSPFGNNGNSQGAATGTVRVEPVIDITRATSSLKLRGNVSHTEYSERYDSTTDYGANLDYNQQVDPRTNINGALAFNSNLLNGNQAILNPVINGTDPTLPPVLDPSNTGGARGRRNSYHAELGLQHQLSSTGSIHLNGSATAVRSESGNQQRDYNYGSVSTGYDRIINDRVTLGAVVSVSRTDYRTTSLGDTTTITPLLSGTLRLSSYWSLSAQAGASFTSTKIIGGTRHSTSASGSISACNTNERWSGCITASRSVLPSSFSGTGNQTSLGVTTNYRLSEYSSISGTVSYARSQQLNGAANSTNDYMSSSVSYNRRLNQRLTMRATAGYSDRFRSTTASRANVSGTIGIQYAFGNI